MVILPLFKMVYLHSVFINSGYPWLLAGRDVIFKCTSAYIHTGSYTANNDTASAKNSNTYVF